MSLKYRADLQVLRGLAVIIVLFYHLQISGFQNGYLGVDIFFVLSGYLMASLYAQGNALDFYNRRLKRLLPAYLVTIGVTTLAVALLTVPSDADQRFDRIWYDLTGLSNVAFWLENSYFDSAAFKPLLNLWSLGVEFQFYLIIPLLLPLLHKRLWLLILAIAGSLIAALIMTTISPKTGFFMMPLRVWEFLFGAAAAWYPIKYLTNSNEAIYAIIALILFSLIIVIHPIDTGSLSVLDGHLGLASIFITLLATLIVMKPLRTVLPEKNALVKFFVRIGDYSYSIYLVHFPIIVLVNYKIFDGTNLGFDNFQTLALILALTAIASYIMYNYVERIRFSKNANVWILILLIAVVMISLIAPAINKQQYTKEQSLIFSAWSDRDVYRCGKISRILNPTETTCKIGTAVNSTDAVFLVGNSHADSLKNIFAAHMASKDIDSYFYVANNPLMSQKTNGKAVAYDAKRLDISNVVIHFSASFYTDSGNIDRLKTFLEELKSADIKAFFISPVPSYDYHVPKALYRDSVDETYLIPPLNVDDYETDIATFHEAMKELSIKQKFIYSSRDLLCPDKTCLIIEDGKPLYFDGSHLTLTGSKKLIPLFNRIAKEIKN